MKTRSLIPIWDGSLFFLRTEIDRLLSLSMLFSFLLVVVRVSHTGRLTFLFLVWNLFLAYVPYVITASMKSYPSRMKSRLLRLPLLLVWLLFIPNSFYILTDLFHLVDRYQDGGMPQWFDLALLLSFAWNGLLLGVLSVWQMGRYLGVTSSLRKEIIFIYPVMWLSALGVYIGRYLRYNSWDILTDPFQLMRDIFTMIIHPLRHQDAWDMIFCFSVLMSFFYLMLKRIGQTLNA
jgi:uncharacterized membrane protein